ncbi:MAG: CopD family protein [Cellulophaga sp.]
MTEFYFYIKALHLIFVVTWFAGLFYVPRLFINHIEASQKPSPEKEILTKLLKVMAKRLWYIITWPSAILATIFAVWLLVLVPDWLQEPWMHIKLGFVLLLFAYHLKTHQIFQQLQQDKIKYSSKFMRIWNEGATLILFSIVFLVMLKSTFNWIFGVVGIFGLAILLMLGIKLYKRIQNKNPEA